MNASATTGDPAAEFERPPSDPLELLRRWIDAAPSRGVGNPMAASLATVGTDGTAGNRFVALTEVTGDGVSFSTGTDSPKGRAMLANPNVALAAHWSESGQQFRLTGVANVLDEDSSDRFFATLPRAARAALVVAEQSELLESQAALVHEAEVLVRGERELVRPATWRGWLVSPTEVRFWVASTTHLHHRLSYRRSGTGWTARRLQP